MLLAIAAKHGPTLERWINFQYATNMDNVTLEQFLMLCPRINTLDMPLSPYLTSEAVFHVANHCSNLVSSVMLTILITDDAVHALMTSCTKLKRLCVPAQFLTPAVFDDFSQLSMLGFNGCQINFTVNEMISAITGGKLRKLRVLKLPQSDLLQYVSAAASGTVGCRLMVEKFTDSKDFLW